MSITDFLLARIAEDEAAARALVLPAHDGYKPHPELSSWRHEPGGEVEYVQTPEMLSHPYPDTLYVTCDGEGLTPSVDEAAGAHIARHDPARVLRECEAKRRMVREWPDPFGQWTAEQAEAAKSIKDGTLRSLALVYSDHPDFNEAWRA